MINNDKGFSLPLSMGLVIVISLLTLSILDYIIPFSRDVKGVENSSNAYYLATSGIEEGLFNIYERNNTNSIDIKTEFSDTNFLNDIDSKYETISSGTLLPPTGEGNSEYDSDWNILSKGKPVQLPIGDGYIDFTVDDLEVIFRVPDLNENGIYNEVLSGSLSSPYTPIINWQLLGNTNILNATNYINSTFVNDSVINTVDVDGSIIDFKGLQGIDLLGNDYRIETFYDQNCNNFGSGCILKFSIINKLETNEPKDIPYLEWQVELNTPSSRKLPLRYTKLEASGKSKGYKKDLDLKISSRTINEIFNFTIFQ